MLCKHERKYFKRFLNSDFIKHFSDVTKKHTAFTISCPRENLHVSLITTHEKADEANFLIEPNMKSPQYADSERTYLNWNAL